MNILVLLILCSHLITNKLNANPIELKGNYDVVLFENPYFTGKNISALFFPVLFISK